MDIMSYIKHPYKILLRLASTNSIKMNDEKYIKLKYKMKMNRTLDLENPQTFNEKLNWLKLYDRNPEYTKMVDKYEVKKYVADKIGEEYIIPTLGIYNNFDEIDFDKLPNQFVMKCTHDSGGLVICRDKNNLNLKQAKKKIEKSLKRNYYYTCREWPYKDVKPRIIIEQYMEDKGEKDLKDYKFFCFNGEPKICLVCSDRENYLKETFYDENWNLFPFSRANHKIDKTIKKPINFEQMQILSIKLSENIPFVRIDFYEIERKTYFGEITFYPAAGTEKFEPEKYDKILGEMLNLGNIKKGKIDLYNYEK